MRCDVRCFYSADAALNDISLTPCHCDVNVGDTQLQQPRHVTGQHGIVLMLTSSNPGGCKLLTQIIFNNDSLLVRSLQRIHMLGVVQSFHFDC